MLALLLACTSPKTDTATESVTWHRDIAPIVGVSCAGCHTDGGIAPFPLTTYDEVVALSAGIHAAVTDRRMPPWGADSSLQDYLDDASLTDDEIALLTDWIDNAMPEGDPADNEDVTAEIPPTLDQIDESVEMASAYVPDFSESPDVYRCFPIDWPGEEAGYVTGIDVRPGNEALVHHVIGFLAAPDAVAAVAALDEADPGAGYSCYGGSGAETAWLGGWVPGKAASVLPEDTGIAVEPGSQVILQVHYNDSGEAGAGAQSAMDFTIASEVQWPGTLQPFTDVEWVYGDSMVIGAGTEDVTYSLTMSLPADLRLYSGGLHMHTLGTSGRLWVERASGEVEWLVSVPSWDFSWQQSYWLADPIDFDSGDSIGLECQWSNPGSEDVGWGEGTADEMCLGLIYLTNR
jgi:mono/diheme cytochrome c family protein